ncbi:mCG146028, partial [Mus musculus]
RLWALLRLWDRYIPVPQWVIIRAAFLHVIVRMLPPHPPHRLEIMKIHCWPFPGYSPRKITKVHFVLLLRSPKRSEMEEVSFEADVSWLHPLRGHQELSPLWTRGLFPCPL